MSNVEDRVRETLRRHEAEVPLLDWSDARPLARRTRRYQALNTLGISLLAIVLALGAAGGIGALLRAGESTPARPDNHEPSPTERVGFIGVPPEGAQPSGPETGELVLSLHGGLSSDGIQTTLFVYADGRMIWEKHGAPTGVPEGASETATGYLEQRLTSDGVELLRSEILSTGLFDGELKLDGSGSSLGLSIQLQNGDRWVSVIWQEGEGGRPATETQAQSMERLVIRLIDPGAWLPETAWAVREIQAFVASSYNVDFSLIHKPNGECCRRPVPSELPPPADELLGPRLHQCVTTDEARAIAEGFEAAGIEPDVEQGPFFAPAGVMFDTETDPTISETHRQYVILQPSLPHSGCSRDVAR